MSSLKVQRVSLEGYRSIRKLSFPLSQLNIFVGENGVGKTNLYRGLQLAHAAATGGLARELAAEGGMESALWTGKRQSKKPARIKIQVDLGFDDSGAESGLFQESVELGVRSPTAAGFMLEPQIKEEKLTFLGGKHSQILLERKNNFCYARDEEGVRHDLEGDLLPSETALANLKDPGRYPDINLVRETLQGWRFFHTFRTDLESLLRQPCLAITAPILSSDGSDLAAVFATLAHVRGDTHDLDVAVADAFPGARLVIPDPGRTATFGMRYEEFDKRLFQASELSDGTLRFLALAGALLSYRAPNFIALNEPETSLHPDLFPALGRLIARASRTSQLWIVTHSQALADSILEETGVSPRKVVKVDGETKIEGLTSVGEFTE